MEWLFNITIVMKSLVVTSEDALLPNVTQEIFMSEQTITHVRKNDDGVITHVKVNGQYTKGQMIEKIQSGEKFVVPSGAGVHTVAGKYIRTDGNDTEADNLGNLPSF
jgi:hypothetical protein